MNTLINSADHGPGTKRSILFVCLFLVAATLLCYGQVQNHDFINFDDPMYIADNPHVQSGLSRESFVWAFTTTHASNWHPFTWLSHMLDCSLYALDPSGHHLTNVLLHIVNTLLLFLLLVRLTAAFWQSAFVGALFALHPLHVESVAWMSERKDVLSAFFCLLTIWAYARYTERPNIHKYLLVIVLFAFGLLTKPMLVTLPVLLLLLDFWPLRRHKWSRALGEKIPMFFLAGLSSAVTIMAQQHGEAVKSLDAFPMKVRTANAIVSYVGYLGKTVWPNELSVYYPHPGMPPMWQIVLSALVLICISLAAVALARRAPYLAVGWLWYLGSLFPVIGIVQVGLQGMADRYTYLPLIGLFIMIAWATPRLLPRFRHKTGLLAMSAAVILVALIMHTHYLVSRWQNSVTLFEHALQVTTNNSVAHNSLGKAFADSGRWDDAIVQYTKALAIRPDYAKAINNLGAALANQGQVGKAIEQYLKALGIEPDYAPAHNNLGVALAGQGNFQEAISRFSEAIRINPDYEDAHHNLELALQLTGAVYTAE